MGGNTLEEGWAYRRALGCFATGVCLITVADGAGPAAITVNSFTSVSLEPRLILWCLDAGSDRYRLFAEAEAFGVNILNSDQQSVSARFAKPGASRIEPEWIEYWQGSPVLNQGLARLACRTHNRVIMGDHLVIVGEVHRFDAEPGPGLTYFRGRYGEALEPAA
jgi:flavin reductase (DIM6/NTAB) family NADH-FMN oxidoreductase RutF